jgi:DNA helicase TIP49 (TBP-interacting protein)
VERRITTSEKGELKEEEEKKQKLYLHKMDWKMGRAHASTFFFSQYSHKEKEIQKRQADRQIKKRYRKKEKREKETKEHSVCGP